MATVTERRVIVVDVKGSAAAVAHMKGLQKAAKNVDTNIGRMQKTMTSLGNTMKAFIAYRITAYVSSIVPAFISLNDSVTSMRARLENANDSMTDTVGLMTELFDVAERSRGSIESVSTLYTRLAASTKNLNVTQQETLDFTELLSSSFVLSGASAGEAASGVTQMSQAMSKGKLDGDEFKSIMENNVYFATLLADSLGVTRGELQEMSKAGELTAEKLIKVGDGLEKVREDMERMPVTSAQVATAWGNAFAQMLTDSETLSEYMNERFKILRDLANNFADTFDTSYEAKVKKSFEETNELIRKQITLRQQLADVSSNPSFLDRLFRTQEKQQNQLDVLNISLGKQVELREQLATANEPQWQRLPDDEGLDPEPSSGGGSGEISARQESLNDYRKSLTESQSDIDLFASKMRILDELFFKEDISESVWNTELEKLTGNLGEATGQLSAFDAEIAKMREDQVASTDMLFAANEAYNNQKITLDELITIQDRYAESAKWANEQAFGEEAQDSIINWKSVAETAIGGITGSLIDMAVSGKNSFEDFAKSFLLNISKMIAQQIVLNALKNSTVFGGLFADGGVINNGVQAFASGGVVTSPTIFPMANGTGLMGEAGPEAIMPLSRGANGKLGVQAEGGGGGVTIIQNINGNGDEALARAVQEGAQRGYQMSVNDVKRNGPMRRQMGV